MNQNIKNHRRFYPLFHFFLIPALIFLTGFTVVRAIKNPVYEHVMIAILFFLVLVTAFLARVFAMKAQDRAIRAEVNFRYFATTGKLLPQELKLGQVVALRFASDSEFVALADRAAKESLSSIEIKKAIVTWKGDYHRV